MHVQCREPTKASKRFLILKKTTGFCPSRSYYSMYSILYQPSYLSQFCVWLFRANCLKKICFYMEVKVDVRLGDEEELDTTRQRQLTITVGLSAKLVSWQNVIPNNANDLSESNSTVQCTFVQVYETVLLTSLIVGERTILARPATRISLVTSSTKYC